jgi:hypothetical protein
MRISCAGRGWQPSRITFGLVDYQKARINMRNNNRALPTVSLLCTFLLGAILFWSFGRNWLNIESLLVFLIGLIGVAIPVLLLGVWNILRHSDDKN